MAFRVSYHISRRVLPEGMRFKELPSEAAPVVLVVEDEVLVRMVIAEYLRDCGFQVVESANAAEALRVLQSDKSVDIVSSDINMPGSRNGLSWPNGCGGSPPAIKVLLASGEPQKGECGGRPL